MKWRIAVAVGMAGVLWFAQGAQVLAPLRGTESPTRVVITRPEATDPDDGPHREAARNPLRLSYENHDATESAVNAADFIRTTEGTWRVIRPGDDPSVARGVTNGFVALLLLLLLGGVSYWQLRSLGALSPAHGLSR